MLLRKIIYGIIAVILLVLSIWGIMFRTGPSGVGHEQEAPDNIELARERFARTPASITRQEILAMRTITNPYHIAKAQELGISGLVDSGVVQEVLRQKKLVGIQENRLWRIHELKNSIPCVTPATLRLLELIGKRFQENLRKANLPAFRYTISSVLRTREQQAHLTRINRNASRDVSSHEYGISVDILFREFDYAGQEGQSVLQRAGGQNPDADSSKAAFDALGMQYAAVLKAILARTLISLQDEGKCYVIIERRQPVFHVTLAGEI